MYACTKFQLIWATSDFGIKIAQKNIDDKSFEKKKKTALKLKQSTSVPNFSQFEELQIDKKPRLTKST